MTSAGMGSGFNFAASDEIAGPRDEDMAGFEADGGKLSPAGRRAAIAASLQLVGVYFSKGTTSGLEDQAALQRSADPAAETDTLVAALRLRAAIAASRRLILLLDRINRRPNFRYTANKAESIGRIVGRLDVLRFSRQVSRVTSPPTYPVIDINRGIETPENTLAYAAGLLILRELNSAEVLNVFPTGGPEHREARTAASQLRRILRMPAFLACKVAAQETLRFHALRRLNSRVVRRVEAGHVGNAGPYRDLTEWVSEMLSGQPIAEPGDIDWSFYGDDFDTKLYELWCLHLLASAVSDRLSTDSQQVNPTWRSGGAAYSWRRPAGLLELRFQQSPQHITGGLVGPRWARVKSSGELGKPLSGVPDITARSVLSDGTDQLVILDPKLRQRSGAPTEELYKLLGYFENYGIRDNPRGVILFYTTLSASLPVYRYTLENEVGSLMAVGLNPAALDASREAIQPVVDVLLDTLGIRIPPPTKSDELSPEENAEEGVIQSRLGELRQFSAVLGMSLKSSRERIEMTLGEPYWGALSEDLQVILATSEHVGFTMDPLGDFSAAVIGLCAGLETIIDDALVSEVKKSTTGLRKFYTFGQTVAAMRKGLEGDVDDVFARAIRKRIDELDLDLTACASLVEKLELIVAEYRNPAAHKELLSKAKWRSAWRDTLGEGGLYREVMDTLGIQTVPNRLHLERRPSLGPSNNEQAGRG